MTVTVRLFARARDLAGADAVSVELPAGATAADLRRRLAAHRLLVLGELLFDRQGGALQDFRQPRMLGHQPPPQIPHGRPVRKLHRNYIAARDLPGPRE